MVDLKPGQTYVPGTSAKVARRLLEAARRVGLDPKAVVKTTEGGFVVPEVVATNAAEPPVRAQAAKKPAAKPASKAAAKKPATEKPDTDSSTAAPRRRRKKNPQKGT